MPVGRAKLTLTTYEYLALAVIEQNPGVNAYRIHKITKDQGLIVIPVNPAYKVTATLERDGRIEGEVSRVHSNGGDVRGYTITARGKTDLSRFRRALRIAPKKGDS